MPITPSSRAITSTEPTTGWKRRRGAAALIALLALAGTALALTSRPEAAPDAPAPVAGQVAGQAASVPAPAVVDPGTPSFFEPFDRLDERRWFVSDGWVNGDHQGCTWARRNVSVRRGVLQLMLAKGQNRLRPYECAELRTVKHLGYGTYEGRLRTAAGSGLNTALFSYSNEARDEIDFEFLGRNPTGVQLNYWLTGRGGHESVPALGHDASAGFHDYAFVWAPDGIRWFVDGRLVREATGADLPRTPGSLVLTLWNGSTGVNDWLGAFDASRTPQLAEVDWVAFTRAGETCRFPESVTCRAR